MKSTVLMPLPSRDSDPTESAVPWKFLTENGVTVHFATPNAQPAICDERMLNGKGLGLLAPLLAADRRGRDAYALMANSREFQMPMSWDQIRAGEFDGLLLPGGHAPGMREYLASTVLQSRVADFFSTEKSVGAICHGVVLAARSQHQGQSVLRNRKTTALLKTQEISAWLITCAWLGNYYRTYPETVEDEVKSVLQNPDDFVRGPPPLRRDGPESLDRGFTVRDGRYLSARWPGDAHRFAHDFLEMLRTTSSARA